MFNPILQYEYGLPIGLNDKLVAYYNLNGNMTENTGLSPSASGSNITYTTGISGQAPIFGTSTWIDIPDNDNFSFTTGGGNDLPFSISIWVYFTTFTTTGGDYGNWLINKRNTTAGGDEWQLVKYKEDLYFAKFDGVNNAIYQAIKTFGNPFTLNNWYHVVYTDDGSKTLSGMKYYVNASLVSTTSAGVGTYTGMNNGSSKTRLGLNAWDNTSTNLRHQGYIDEVAIWKGRELKLNEITQLYNSGVGKFYPF